MYKVTTSPKHQGRSERLGTTPIPKLIISMSLPAMISMLVQALYNVVDSLFVSRLGEDALTAVSLAFPLQLLVVAAFVGLGIGINANTSRRLGQGNLQAARQVSTQGFLIGLVLSILVALIGIFLTRPYFLLYTDNTYIIEEGTRYTIIVTVLSFFRILAQTATSTLQGTGQMFHPMVAQLIGALLNIVLDPIMIFGFAGFPALGVTGAAIATVVSQFISMAYIWYVLTFGDSPIKPEWRGLRYNPEISSDIIKVGLPAAIMQGLGSVMLAGVNGILAPFGATAIAVMGIYFKLQSLVFMPIFGLNTGTLPVVGFSYGAKNRHRLLGAVRFSSLVATGYMSLSLILFQWIPNQMLMIFDASPAMLDMGMPALKTISLSFPLVAATVIISGSLNGLGKSNYSLIISIVRQFGILLPAAYLLGQSLGLRGVWYGFVLAELVGISLTLLLFRRALKLQLPQ